MAQRKLQKRMVTKRGRGDHRNTGWRTQFAHKKGQVMRLKALGLAETNSQRIRFLQPPRLRILVFCRLLGTLPVWPGPEKRFPM